MRATLTTLLLLATAVAPAHGQDDLVRAEVSRLASRKEHIDAELADLDRGEQKLLKHLRSLSRQANRIALQINPLRIRQELLVRQGRQLDNLPPVIAIDSGQVRTGLVVPSKHRVVTHQGQSFVLVDLLALQRSIAVAQGKINERLEALRNQMLPVLASVYDALGRFESSIDARRRHRRELALIEFRMESLGLAPIFTLEATASEELDEGRISPLLDTFEDVRRRPSRRASVEVVEAGQRWVVTNPGNARRVWLTKTPAGIAVREGARGRHSSHIQRRARVAASNSLDRLDSRLSKRELQRAAVERAISTLETLTDPS